MRFSQRVGQLENEVVKNEKNSLQLKVDMLERVNKDLLKKVEEYEKVVRELKQEKCMRDVSMLHNNYSQEDVVVPRSNEVTAKVENYLNDKNKKMEIKSIK